MNPGVEGLMMDLFISPDNRFVAAYTNNNQTILLNALISEFQVIENVLGKSETVAGLVMLDTNLIIYGQYTWALFTTAGKQLSTKKTFREDPILVMIVESTSLYSIFHWSGDATNPRMAIDTYVDDERAKPLEFHTAFALNAKQNCLWVNTGDIENFNVVMYTFKDGCWNSAVEYPENKHPLLQLSLDPGEQV